jgi:hypothetical protein
MIELFSHLELGPFYARQGSLPAVGEFDGVLHL